MQSAILNSWIGLGCILLYTFVGLSWGDTVFGAIAASPFLMFGAVLAMNSMARIDLLLHIPRSRRKLSKIALRYGGIRWFIRRINHISNEGEHMGIAVAVLTAFVLVANGQNEELLATIEHAFPMAMTLLGIMSAANVAVRHMLPLLDAIERVFGTKAALAVGSLAGSLVGEPADAVVLAEWVKERVVPGKEAEVATGLAASIGSGGGLTPFAAPPILIVWPTLQKEFHWTIGSLLLFIGVGCVLHVIFSVLRFGRYIEKRKGSGRRMTRSSVLPILFMLIVVGAHIAAALAAGSGGHGDHAEQHMNIPLVILDLIAGIINWFTSHYSFKKLKEQIGYTPPANPDEPDELVEDEFTAKWQPLTLAVLLIGLDVIGMGVDPGVKWVALNVIPASAPIIVTGLILAGFTAVLSHFADNALASRVVIMVAVALIPIVGPDAANFLASCVLMGALFGGFLLVPANLPNFYLRRVFRIDEKEWGKTAWRNLYKQTAPAYILWIVILWQVHPYMS